MNAHTKESFEEFFSKLSKTNTTLSYWTDFEKVKKNVAKIEIRLNTLNFLLGKQDLRSAVKELWDVDKHVFEVLQILVACRKRDKKQVINSDAEFVLLENYLTSFEGVMEYLEGTGLASVFRDKDIKNLVDYVFGIEVGLDTNARKNRTGKAMEDLLELIFKGSSIMYRKQVNSSEWPEISEVLGDDIKRFDFVVTLKDTTYLIEANFYNSSGSKPNEIARSYSEVASKVNNIPGFEFVWITDGYGWKSSKNKLCEAYYSIPHLYNLSTLKEFIALLKK